MSVSKGLKLIDPRADVISSQKGRKGASTPSGLRDVGIVGSQLFFLVRAKAEENVQNMISILCGSLNSCGQQL